MLKYLTNLAGKLLGHTKPSMTWLHKRGQVVLTAMVLGLGLLVPSSAQALTYVSLLAEPPAPEIQHDLAVGVDIDVYWTVYNETNGQNEWWVIHLTNQHDLHEARALINAELADNKHLPPHKQHSITIGWHRRQ